MKKLIKITFLLAAVTLFSVAKTQAQVSVGVTLQANIAPPAIPTYDQPPCPEDGYLWEPGYWSWDSTQNDYYWVPGVWVAPPSPNMLWTPGYWGYDSNVYVFHAGYWGPHVGFYGGINYGGGYFGLGFAGGGWSGGHFRYNTAVWNVDRTRVRNVYVDKTVIQKHTVANNNHVSFNGGKGGLTTRPRTQEGQANREKHVQVTQEQQNHVQSARADKSQFHSVNHGTPSRPSMPRVGGGQRGGGGRGKH
jgi:WXXGXW repeat (2 copies)